MKSIGDDLACDYSETAILLDVVDPASDDVEDYPGVHAFSGCHVSHYDRPSRDILNIEHRGVLLVWGPQGLGHIPRESHNLLDKGYFLCVLFTYAGVLKGQLEDHVLAGHALKPDQLLVEGAGGALVWLAVTGEAFSVAGLASAIDLVGVVFGEVVACFALKAAVE